MQVKKYREIQSCIFVHFFIGTYFNPLSVICVMPLQPYTVLFHRSPLLKTCAFWISLILKNVQPHVYIYCIISYCLLHLFDSIMTIVNSGGVNYHKIHPIKSNVFFNPHLTNKKYLFALIVIMRNLTIIMYQWRVKGM